MGCLSLDRGVTQEEDPKAAHDCAELVTSMGPGQLPLFEDKGVTMGRSVYTECRR